MSINFRNIIKWSTSDGYVSKVNSSISGCEIWPNSELVLKRIELADISRTSLYSRYSCPRTVPIYDGTTKKNTSISIGVDNSIGSESGHTYEYWTQATYPTVIDNTRYSTKYYAIGNVVSGNANVTLDSGAEFGWTNDSTSSEDRRKKAGSFNLVFEYTGTVPATYRITIPGTKMQKYIVSDNLNDFSIYTWSGLTIDKYQSIIKENDLESVDLYSSSNALQTMYDSLRQTLNDNQGSVTVDTGDIKINNYVGFSSSGIDSFSDDITFDLTITSTGVQSVTFSSSEKELTWSKTKTGVTSLGTVYWPQYLDTTVNGSFYIAKTWGSATFYDRKHISGSYTGPDTGKASWRVWGGQPARTYNVYYITGWKCADDTIDDVTCTRIS